MTDSVASPSTTGSDADPGTAGSRIGRLRPGPDDDVGRRRAGPMPGVRAALADRLPLSLRAGALDPAARGAIVLAAVAVLAALVAAFFAWQARPVEAGGGAGAPAISATTAATSAPADLFPSPSTSGSAAASAQPGGPTAEVVVDVAGKVRHPGVVRLPDGSRVVDAVTSAGGVLPGVDTSALSLARKLVDGEQILVTGQPATAPPAGTGVAGSTSAPGAAGASAGPVTLVNLNTATLEQLDGLPGVGPVLAQRIVDYRQENGGFSNVDQLGDVKGVGPKRAADLKPLVSVR